MRKNGNKSKSKTNDRTNENKLELPTCKWNVLLQALPFAFVPCAIWAGRLACLLLCYTMRGGLLTISLSMLINSSSSSINGSKFGTMDNGLLCASFHCVLVFTFYHLSMNSYLLMCFVRHYSSLLLKPLVVRIFTWKFVSIHLDFGAFSCDFGLFFSFGKSMHVSTKQWVCAQWKSNYLQLLQEEISWVQPFKRTRDVLAIKSID